VRIESARPEGSRGGPAGAATSRSSPIGPRSTGAGAGGPLALSNCASTRLRHVRPAGRRGRSHPPQGRGRGGPRFPQPSVLVPEHHDEKTRLESKRGLKRAADSRVRVREFCTGSAGPEEPALTRGAAGNLHDPCQAHERGQDIDPFSGSYRITVLSFVDGWRTSSKRRETSAWRALSCRARLSSSRRARMSFASRSSSSANSSASIPPE
jgi:hypothetical protein